MRRLLHAALLVGMTGCGASLELLDHQPSFSGTALRADGIVTLGAVGSDSRRSTRLLLTSELDRAFAARGRDLRPAPSDTVRERMGEDLYLDLVSRYRAHGVLDSTDLAIIDDRVGTLGRYLAVARLEGDEVLESQTETESAQEDGTYQTSTSRETKRSISVSGRVYDLKSRTAVWSARMIASSKEVNVSSDKVSQARNLTDLAVEVILGALAPKEDETHPPPPGLELPARKAFRKMVESLPRP